MKINDIWTVRVEMERKLCVFKYLPDYYRSATISLETRLQMANIYISLSFSLAIFFLDPQEEVSILAVLF